MKGKEIMKRFVSVALVLLMIVALVGCGSKKREPIILTLSTEDSEAILNAAGVRLPERETAAGADSSIIYLGTEDLMNNYSEDEIINTGFWTFREKYGGSVIFEETTYDERFDKLAQDVVGGSPPDFFSCGVSSEATFPMYCINGSFQPVDKYVDYTDPLWEAMADAAEAFALGERHFAFVTDITFRNIVPYNRRVLEEYGYDDPADLYYNDEWTWDVFYEMCMDFSDPDEDRYALDGYAYNGALVQEATGRKIIHKDENGDYYAEMDDPYIEAANDLIYNLKKNECVYHEGTNYWAGRNNHEEGAGVKDGLCLFYITVFGNIQRTVAEMEAVWGDVTNHEFMFAPLPRYQNGDGEYYLASIPTGFMLVENARNPEGVALYAACDRFKRMDSVVMSIDKKQLKEKYLWTDEMLDMYDECREIILKNSGMYLNGNLTDNVNNAYNAFRDKVARDSGATSWAQVKEEYKDQLDYYLEEQNDIIRDYIDSLG